MCKYAATSRGVAPNLHTSARLVLVWGSCDGTLRMCNVGMRQQFCTVLTGYLGR
jgi:hypothetical protein